MMIAMTAPPSCESSEGGSLGSNRDPDTDPSPMQAWWEGIAKARSRIQALINILGPLHSLQSLQDSERPAKALLESEEIAHHIIARLNEEPSSGSGDDQLCQWFYETFQAGDPDLQLVVVRYVPVLAGIYLSRVVVKGVKEPLAGFEAVMLALYTMETKIRRGRPLTINIPDLGQPSLYHAPRNSSSAALAQPFVGQVSAPLEPQLAVKSTKRACIVGVALDLFYRKISIMPAGSKVEICEFVEGWAGQNCFCARRFDRMDDGVGLTPSPQCGNPAGVVEDDGVGEVTENRPTPALETDSNNCISEMGKFCIHDSGSVNVNVNDLSSFVCEMGKFCVPDLGSGNDSGPLREGSSGNSVPSNPEPVQYSRAKGTRIPLSWELLQPILRILGHCLLAPLSPQEVRDAASSATRALFARVSHDLLPEAILATRSLIHLDIAARAAAMAATTAASVTMNGNSLIKPKKPELMLASK